MQQILFQKLLTFSAASAIAILLSACGGDGSAEKDGDDANRSIEDELASEIPFNLQNAQKLLKTNADIAYAAYSDSVDTAVDLKNAITAFEGDRSQDNLDAAKRAWLVAREPYGQTEVYRFRLSPIDSTDYQSEDGPEGEINAWPLGEALIDYVSRGSDFGDGEVSVSSHSTGLNYPTENIINSSITIDDALLSTSASANDEHDVIAGYHAIEFMLWGQDLNLDSSADTENSREMSTSGNVLNSGGHRPLADFTDDNPLAQRRFDYLNAVVNKLISDLRGVREGWSEGAAYRTAFTRINNEAEAKQKLSEILTGMGTLSEGELAGERMQIAFSSNSQEDEHSCFSDNTHRDIWLDAEGVSNSYYGDYAGYDNTLNGIDNETTRAVKGYGFDDYLADSGEVELARAIEVALDKTEEGYRAIDASARVYGIPVDRLIMDENRNAANPMYKTIIALNEQSALIADLAEGLKIEKDVVEEEASGCDTSVPTESC